MEEVWIYIDSSEGVGKEELSSFDNALLKAGVGNVNLVKLSSVIPETAKFIDKLPTLEIGEVIPAVYSHITIKEGVASCGIGYATIKGRRGGLFYEYHDKVEEKVVREKLENMLKEAFEMRGWEIDEMKIITKEVRANDGLYHTALTIAAYITRP